MMLPVLDGNILPGRQCVSVSIGDVVYAFFMTMRYIIVSVRRVSNVQSIFLHLERR